MGFGKLRLHQRLQKNSFHGRRVTSVCTELTSAEFRKDIGNWNKYRDLRPSSTIIHLRNMPQLPLCPLLG